MILPEPVQNPHEPITKEEALARIAAGYWDTDSPALKLVVGDALKAEQAEQTKNYCMGWAAARTLFESPYVARYWPGTQSEAASIPFFTVATAVRGLTPQVIAGLFYENPPFVPQERSGTTAQAARAQAALLGYQLEDIDFRQELTLGIDNCLLFGTAIFQYGWEKFERERKIIKRKAPVKIIPTGIPGAPPTKITDSELEEEVITEQVDRPCFEHIVNHREVLVDPSLNVPDIQKAKYVVRRRYVTWEDLDKLRDQIGYDIPSREKLLELFLPPQEPVEAATNELGSRSPLWDARAQPKWEDATVDPLQKPLELLERWDNKTYIVVLQKKLVIYNDRNVYGKIPFLSVGWWDVPGAFWSLGLGRTIGSEQRLQTGIMNLALDILNLNLNPPLVRVRGKSIPTQSIRIGPGKIIEVDAKDDLKPLERFAPVPEAMEMMAASQARAEVVGANSITSLGQAGSSGHSNLARSSAGAQGLMQGAASGLSEFVDKLANQVFVPFLYAMAEMNRAMLPEDQLDHIMSQELKETYLAEDGTPGDNLDILNARVKFSILAGSKMQSRRNMAQALPLLSQTLASPALTQQLSVQGKKIDWLEITRMWFTAGEFPNYNDVVVDMNPQDLARQQAQTQQAAAQSKGAVQAQLQDQKFQQQQQLADSENIARAARDALREGWKKSVEPEMLTGVPQNSGVGFGGMA